ncbi:MAG: hypothetical protein IJ590_00815 [Rickettsiales bacterium]|nr:hypothetical protein [Rickettsiales bacterium]
MSSAVDKLVKNNENGEAKKKDDVKKNEANDKEPDPEKILEAKKKQPLMNNLMLLKKAVLQYQKGHASNLLERAQKTEQFNEQFARSETQNKEALCNAILQNQQEKIQMAQTEADRAYEERKAEYIQRIFREERERLQERQQGQNPDDPILRLQQENKGINDDYEKFKKDMKQMNEKIDKDYKELEKKYQLDENGHKKEDKDKKKQDKKTLDIRGLKNVDNGKLDAVDLKDKKEEKKKSFLGL